MKIYYFCMGHLPELEFLIYLHYSIVKDSNADLGVIFRFLQNSPITNAVCTKMSEFFFEFLAILWYFHEKIKRLYWGSQQSRSNFYSWESMLRVSPSVWHYFLKVSDEIGHCRFVHFDLLVPQVPGPLDQSPPGIQLDSGYESLLFLHGPSPWLGIFDLSSKPWIVGLDRWTYLKGSAVQVQLWRVRVHFEGCPNDLAPFFKCFC